MRTRAKGQDRERGTETDRQTDTGRGTKSYTCPCKELGLGLGPPRCLPLQRHMCPCPRLAFGWERERIHQNMFNSRSLLEEMIRQPY